eukprot:scaffold123632_cov42-Phaeocystis_antarctica.AAC.1
MRLARESAEYAQDPDAADFMSSASGARPASQASQPPPRSQQQQQPRQPVQPQQPRAAPQRAPAPPPAANAYGGNYDSNPCLGCSRLFYPGCRPVPPRLQPYAPELQP